MTRFGRVVSLIVVMLSLMITPVCAGAATSVSIAHPWDTTSHTHKGLVAAVAAFASKYPDIQVDIRYGVSEDKFVVESLGGTPADIQSLDGPMVSSYALRGFIQPLDGYLRKSRVVEADFVPPSWRQNVWEGQVWAMPYIVDPNFALIWNKDLFDNAGLNSDVGPVTLLEYEAHHKKLTRYEGDKVTVIGTVPWDVYGNANTMYTWGWIFGGRFFDTASKQVIAEHPNNVRALTWLRDYYQRFSPSLAELNSGLPSGRNRFTAGREAMRFSVTGELFDYLTAAPDVSIGLGKMPYDPASGVTDPAWVGGHTLAIPKAAKNPDAGWEFLRFVTADPEGSTAWAQGSGWFPGYLRSPVFREKFARDPYLGPYMQILLGATNQRPVMPVQKRYWEELDSALNDVFALAIQPLEALQRVSQRVQDELATVMSGE